MKKLLIEQLKRIHRLNYGNKVLEEGFLDNILGKNEKKIDDPKKADLVSNDVKDFFSTLEKASSGGGISQQEKGSMTFQKEVESMQIGLVILGYELPKHGIDGLFGPETASAVTKFINDNLKKQEVNEVTLSSPIGQTSVNSPYGPRWGRKHAGVDLKADSGTQVKSPLDGEVIDAEIRADDCGGTIYIKHADGYKTRYCHCKQINVKKGDIIKKGDVIGLSGGSSKDIGRGRSDGAHLHFEVYKDGKVVDPMEHLGSEVGEFVGGKSSEKMISATPEMLNKLIELLKQKGIKSEDIKKHIDQSVSGITQKIDVSDFESITNTVIKTFEGGYYHPDMLKDGRVKDSRYGNSGETMFGIDRKAGGKMTNEGPAAQEFWKLIDDANARTNWQWNYMGGPLESRLRKLTSDIIKPYFVSNVNRFLNPEAREIVLNDKKLMVNFAYATWNGSGWFQKFANVINDAVKSGTTDPEQLSDILLKRRLNSGNSLIAQGGKKMEKLINSMA